MILSAPADGGATEISCSVVLKLGSGPTSHQLVRKVSIDTGFLHQGHSGIRRLTLPALWSALKSRAQDATKVPLSIALVAVLLELDPASILVATTRNLIFDGAGYRDPENGYRVLGLLSSFSLEWEHHIPFDHFHETTDIFGISRDSQPNHTFMSTWEDTDVHLNTHFALILHLLPDACVHNPALLETNLTASSPTFGVRIPSLPAFWPSPPPTPPHRSRREAPLHDPPSPLPSTPLSSPSTHSPLSSPSPTNQEDIVDEILSSFNAHEAAFLKANAVAKKGSRTTGLAALAVRFYAMQKVLDRVLGNHGSLKLRDGTSLNRGEILVQFGWRVNTFTNKIAVYAKGKEIASRLWTAPIPDCTNVFQYTLYTRFEGVRYLWHSVDVENSGTLHRRHRTNNCPADWAAQLSESDISRTLLQDITPFTSSSLPWRIHHSYSTA
ncbi:hypothetical protein C8F01DRAFT_1261489 [Mycena amicta]|nr:hypothetical protein C8F01DRAFT_1261489 [Mycena amicta]